MREIDSCRRRRTDGWTDGRTDRQTFNDLKKTSSRNVVDRCSSQIRCIVLNFQCKVLSTVDLSNLFVLSTVPPPFYLDFDRQTDRQKDKQTDRHTDTQTDSRHTDRQETDRPTDRQTDRQTERQTDEKRNKQTERKTDKQKEKD